ncbi:MAG: C-terminal binding protein [Synergistaceae bacterium]|jgi:phosphoglycerate dehydrogenase-like enzyme|nr:C-terminal binding protein [Synergistaceae bacterium]
MPKVGIYSVFNFAECDLERPIFEKAGVEMIVCQNDDDYRAMLPEIDALIVANLPVTADDISRMGRCKVIVRQGMGVDNIDVGAATKRDIAVCNIPAYNIEEVSDYALAAILTLLRHLAFYDQSIKYRKVSQYAAFPIMKRFKEVSIGILGFGKIGQLLAKKARPLFKRIMAYDPFINREKAAELGVEVTQLDDLLASSDVISLHLPYTKETHHLIDRSAFAKIKRGAYIVNAARGGIIDDSALLEAIERGDVQGAVLDMTEEMEWPKLDNPIYNNLLIINTPHCAWYTQEALDTSRIVAAEEVVDVIQGRTPVGKLN